MNRFVSAPAPSHRIPHCLDGPPAPTLSPRIVSYADPPSLAPETDTSQQGQFFPFFILTLSGLVTLPLTYTLVRPSSDDTKRAPRIKTDYKPQHADVVQALRSADQKKQRRVKRALVVALGWTIMAGMVYLIMVTQRTIPKIWNPYDILGISDVSFQPPAAPRRRTPLLHFNLGARLTAHV